MSWLTRYLQFFLFTAAMLVNRSASAQSSASPAPYCNGTYQNGTCNQPNVSNTPGNSVNDFIDDFITSGGNVNISNTNSGCNGNPGNYINYCQHYLQVTAGQVITCTVQSGITYAQGFVIFVDWNQDNVFSSTTEMMAYTSSVPTAATATTLTFSIPSAQANGTYRLRVRCAFSTIGNQITPCGQFGYGETEDYSIFVGPVPATSGVISITAGVNSPVCYGQSINFNSTINNSLVTYTWTGPNAFSSTAQNPTIANATPLASGIYTIVSGGTCPATKTLQVKVSPDPSFVLSPLSPTICQSNSFTGSVGFTNPGSATLNPNQFQYGWVCFVPPGIFQPGGLGAGIYSPGSPTTTIAPSLINAPSATLIYTVIVTPTLVTCQVSHTLALTISNPVTPSLSLPTNICNNSAPIVLTATPGGGTWSGVAISSPTGVLTPALYPVSAIGINTVAYSVNVGTCTVNNTGTFMVSQYIEPTLITGLNTLCVDDSPVDLMSIVQNTLNGNWSGTHVSNNNFDPHNLPTGSYNLTYTTNSAPVLNVCPASTVLAVSVYSPPKPLINAIAHRCNNTGTIQLTATPSQNLLWTGNAGVSSTGVLSPSSCVIGLNTIFVQGGTGTCVAHSDTTFVIEEFRTAVFSGTINNLCTTSSPVNLLSIAQNTNGTWYSPYVNNNSNVFSPTNPVILPTGVYTLTYTNRSFDGTNRTSLCTDSRTIAVSVLNPPTPNISPVAAQCNVSGPIQLTVTPHTGAWVASPYLTTSGLFTPSLCPVGNNPAQYIIGTNTCNMQQTMSVSVEGFVPATISGSIAEQCVSNLPVNLAPLTLNTSGSWNGPGILGASFSPSLAGTGTMTIFYRTASVPSGLCPDHDSLTVPVYSLATPVFGESGPYCTSHMPVQLPVSPIGGVFAGANTSAVNIGGLFLPAAAHTGNNMINYSITVGPCVAYAQATIAIEEFVPAGFVANAGPFCRNDVRQAFNLDQVAASPGGMWQGPGVSGNIFHFSSADKNNNIIHRTHSFPTDALCPDESTLQISVYDAPTVAISAVPNTGCAPLDIGLNSNVNFGDGTWRFSDTSGTLEGINARRTFTSQGSYSVTFSYSTEVTTDLMCIAYAQAAIRVYESPEPDFAVPSEIMISDPDVHFMNTSVNAEHNRYLWTFAGSGVQSSSQDIDADYTFPKVGPYRITLKATSLYGCANEVTKDVLVNTIFNVYIPSSFTPNGDGKNDYFFPVFTEYGLDANHYELQIFDRWGGLLFETKDITQHWDGRKAGQALKEDVYVYKLQYKGLDGTLYSKNGTITLIR